MVAILRCFEAASSLGINLSKSTILGVSVHDISLRHLANIMGCKVDSFPSTYLGLPPCLSRVPKSVSNPNVERIEKMLSSWKARYLSQGGRITVIQYAPANLPVYYISILKCLIAIIKRIEKLQHDFLWQGHKESKKFHLVNWKTICSRKDSGGLGIRPLKNINYTLLGKWLWRSDGLRRSILLTKYNVRRND